MTESGIFKRKKKVSDVFHNVMCSWVNYARYPGDDLYIYLKPVGRMQWYFTVLADEGISEGEYTLKIQFDSMNNNPASKNGELVYRQSTSYLLLGEPLYRIGGRVKLFKSDIRSDESGKAWYILHGDSPLNMEKVV